MRLTDIKSLNILPENLRNHEINGMIEDILAEKEYENYTGDEIAAWSEENICKVYNSYYVKDAMIEKIEGLDGWLTEIKMHYPNKVAIEGISNAIENLKKVVDEMRREIK